MTVAAQLTNDGPAVYQLPTARHAAWIDVTTAQGQPANIRETL
ncbi:MAG: hypothetical protein ACRD0W_12210 [Acidimicrobiales bacterium]